MKLCFNNALGDIDWTHDALHSPAFVEQAFPSDKVSVCLSTVEAWSTASSTSRMITGVLRSAAHCRLTGLRDH
jgi:hypothetical protein